MSGIFGIFSRTCGPIHEADLSRMSVSMIHRGPDNQSCWSDGVAGIGHCMLQTTPESLHEVLPYENLEKTLVITTDARIDNRSELGTLLAIKEKVNDGLPDSQLILAAYKKWEKDCVHYLLGDFAFAIWDKQKRQLFCARDHIGVKPFVYYTSHDLFTFASEVRAVSKVDQVPKRLNEGRIADFLLPQLEGIDKTSTFYEEIYRLPPAHTLVVDQQRITLNCYWQPNLTNELHLSSDSEYVEAFRELLFKSVKARLRTNQQPASMLSGGIDSSSIVAISRELIGSNNTQPLRVYSGVSDNDGECRESYFIRLVTQQGGLEATSISPSQSLQYSERLSQIYDVLGEPFDAHMTLIILIYSLANENGHRVMLDGIEGDMVHSLSPNYPGYLIRNFQLSVALQEVAGLWKNYYRKQLPLHKILNRIIRQVVIPDNLRRLRHKILEDSQIKEILDKSVINNNFSDQINIRRRLAKLRKHSCVGLCSSIKMDHLSNIFHPNLTVGIERYDRVAAICSVEPRHPLLDKRLIEFSASLPWNQLVRNGWSKYILRSAIEPHLGKEVSWRQGWEHIGRTFLDQFIEYSFIKNEAEIDISNEYVNKYIQSKYLHRSKKFLSDNTMSKMQWDIMVLRNWINSQYFETM